MTFRFVLSIDSSFCSPTRLGDGIFCLLLNTGVQYILGGSMAHTIRDKEKLLNRVRRLRGQVEAVERLLENESECTDILQQIAACRGSINGLMSEVLEGHIRFHLVERGPKRKSHKGNAVEEVIAIAKSYLR
jgi:FrmR/RcnR family transcriptional regulator, repressor of frmRAB operon